MKDLNYCSGLAQEMIQEDADRDKLFDGVEKMFHMEWVLPEELASVEWIRKTVSSDPHDAVRTGTRILSTLKPNIKIAPPAGNDDTKIYTQSWEYALKYWLDLAGKRKRTNIVRDMVLSALLYDSVAAYVVPLEYQQKLAGQGIGAAKNWKMGQRYGPFIVNVFNPKTVHARFSDIGTEAVYSCSKQKMASLIEFWGSEKLVELYNPDDPRSTQEPFYVHDLTTWEQRTVWVTRGPTPEMGKVLLDVPWTLNFFPWVIKAGGSNIENDPKYQYQPLLASIYFSDQWETQNLVNSIWISDALATAAQAKAIVSGVSPDTVESDFMEPGGRVIVPSGNTYTQNPPRQIDSGLLTIAENIRREISKSTVSEVLMSGDYPSNTQFATINLVTQTALGVLKPHKELAEQALSDVLYNMLYWARELKHAFSFTGLDKENLGNQYILDPDKFDIENAVITVELDPDMPTDKVQRINAAGMAVAQLGMSKETGLEEIGVVDPVREMQKGREEKIFETILQIELEKMRAQSQAEIQMAMQEAQSQNMMIQQAQQQQNMMPETGASGQGFNPAMGGMPAQSMNPEATQIGQTGEDMNGDEYA